VKEGLEKMLGFGIGIGSCETGERFLHVVALGTIPHETLSVLMESCLLDLEPTSRSPEWIAKTDSAGFIRRIILSFERSTHPNVVTTLHLSSKNFRISVVLVISWLLDLLASHGTINFGSVQHPVGDRPSHPI
jgi:hypothetical protein